ncbi:transposase [Klebsiella pneumoniae]
MAGSHASSVSARIPSLTSCNDTELTLRVSFRPQPEPTPHTAAIAAKLKTEQGDAAYRRRKSIVEAPNGWIKAVMGLRQFSMRGLDKVQAEWKLVCMALNLRRMAYL